MDPLQAGSSNDEAGGGDGDRGQASEELPGESDRQSLRKPSVTFNSSDAAHGAEEPPGRRGSSSSFDSSHAAPGTQERPRRGGSGSSLDSSHAAPGAEEQPKRRGSSGSLDSSYAAPGPRRAGSLSSLKAAADSARGPRPVWEFEASANNWERFREDCVDYVERKYEEFQKGGNARIKVRTFWLRVSVDFGSMTQKVEGGGRVRKIRRRMEDDTAQADGEAIDLKRYMEGESIFDALAHTVEGLHPVRLLRMSWLLKQRGGVLHRRQELPEEAFVSAEELRAVWNEGGRGGLRDHVVPVIAISACWDERGHPDPNGVQLARVIDTLQLESGKFAREVESFHGFAEMGIFWDWGSLLQGDPAKLTAAKSAAEDAGKSREEAEEAGSDAERTPAERAAFDHALNETMDLWYAHQGTTIYLLTQHPKERGSQRTTGYEDSGWTTYERCSAEQIKRFNRFHAKWNVVSDLGTSIEDLQPAGRRMSIGDMQAAGRRWPVGPDDFDELIEKMTFTYSADKEKVKTLYRKMSRNQLGGVEQLLLDGMPKPTEEDTSRLGGCLGMCANLKELSLAESQVDDRALTALCRRLEPGALPCLTTLRLQSNSVGDAGAQALASAAAQGSMAQLAKLQLDYNEIGTTGAAALAAQVSAGTLPRMTFLWGNPIGRAGLRALKAAGQPAICREEKERCAHCVVS